MSSVRSEEGGDCGFQAQGSGLIVQYVLVRVGFESVRVRV